MSDTTTPRAHHPAKCPKCAHPVLIYSDATTLILSVRQQMLRAGASLAEVGQVLRQRSALVTSNYARVDRTALRALARPWPGGGR